MRWAFFKPMLYVLAERHRRAEGARHAAEESRVKVQEELRAYNDALRKARGEMFVTQEAARREVLEEKQAAVHAARVAAQQELQTAKQTLAAEVAVVRTHLEQSSSDLASEIAAAILEGDPANAKIPAGERVQ